MKKKVLLSLFSLLFITSCGVKIDDKNYDSYTLYFKDYSEKAGFRYQYLKSDASKELGEKVYKLYKSILGSNESCSDLTKFIGFESTNYYLFNFNYENSYDSIGFSCEDNTVTILYKKTSSSSSIYRSYKSLSSSYLDEVNELKTTFKEMLKDSSWTYGNDI